ncbi:MAG: ATP-binding cassette domain-containing protein [Haloferacaceae archaeon]
MSPAVRTDALSKRYGSVQALNGVSITIERGEVYGLLGPNGAGKTTFIDVLTGLADPTSGTASVFGHDVVEDARRAHDRIGLSPQEFNVDRFFPIREVLKHKAGFHGVPPAEAGERADRVLDQVGLTEKADWEFSALSGGMKRRVLLARALVTEPDLLILDEPTAGVDVQLRRDVWGLVEDLTGDGVTVLLTTHYLEEAEQLCDRICILDGGEVVEIGTPAEFRRKRADTVRVRLDRALENGHGLTEAVADEDGIAAVEADGRTVTVEADRPPEAIAALATRVTDHGRTIADVDVQRTSLEDVFVDITRLDD